MKSASLKNGLIMRIDTNWFVVAPALIAEEGDIDEIYELIRKSLEEALTALKK